VTLEKALVRPALLFCAVALVPGLAPSQTHAPALLVVQKADSSLAIVDPTAKKVLGRVPVGQEPHNVTASADGTLAFVASRGPKNGSASISVIDVAARKELRRVDVGPGSRPHGIVFADGKVYFVLEGYKVVGCFNPSTNRMDWLLGIGQSGTEMLVVSKDMSRIFTSNSATNSISALERVASPPDWRITVIPVGKDPQGIDISPDGKEVWTAHQADGGVSIVDVATRAVTQTLNLRTTSSNRLKFTPDGKLVLISDRDGGELLVLDAARRQEVKRMKMGKRPTDILMEPGGARAYVALTYPLKGDAVSSVNDVAVIDLKTLELAGHISSGANPEGMAWAAAR
jgi:YVTN family beta-propeller protein